MFKKPRGSRDFNTEEMQKRRTVEAVIRSTFKNFGYREIETPTFEKLDLFTTKSGEEIIKEIYSFEDKGGRKLALRPELTAPVIRFYVNKLQMEPKPLKLFYFGNCYRYDRPQKGRYREFKQAGCELIGADTPQAYAELIAMAYKMLKNLRLEDIILNIGNLKILSSIFEKFQLSKEKQEYLRPLIDKNEFDDVLSALEDFNVGSKKAKEFVELLQTSKVEEISNYIKEDEEALEELAKLKKIFYLLKESFGIEEINLKMSIVRGLDYYTGTVFEIENPSLGAEKQICGGGEYKLISLLGGKSTPTAGFALGFDRTILALENEEHEFPESKLDAYIIPVEEELIEESLKIAQKLRNENIETDIDLKRRGLSKALKHADSINAKKAIIVGQKEMKDDSVTIKDMETGEQKKVKIKDLHEKIR